MRIGRCVLPALLACALPVDALAAGPVAQGTQLAFYVFGGLALLGALLTITQRNPVTAALFLIVTLISTAAIFVLVNATFLAAIQVLVYAGAIMVLFIFVVMSVPHPDREEIGLLRGTASKVLGVLGVGLLMGRLIAMLRHHSSPVMATVSDDFGDVVGIGRLLFSDYLYPFEAISVLLLIAIVGAVMVSRRGAAQDVGQA